MADGFLPPLDRPETAWFGSMLYPLRGAESLGVIAVTSAVLWVFTILVPEYCLTLMGDAESMGAPTLGKFIAMISILPVVVLLPLALFYWLQYLGRVLVSSAIGEAVPPRTPDRNFDGVFNGLSPWLIWLLFGVGVSLLPLLCYGFSLSSTADGDYLVAIGLLLLGFPYMLMALMMSFLHDHALAAKPWGVIGAVLRLGASYWFLCLFVASALGLAFATFPIAQLMRPGHFWIYLVLCLLCWVVVQWTFIVVMRVLGVYYFHRRDLLRWHRQRPRWGIAWKL
jgi:hypothetical protein